MIDTVMLPKDRTALARVLRTHAAREEMKMMYRRTMWLLAWYYFNGIRRFTVFDETTGKVTGEYTDANGSLEFQSQELLNRTNQVAARLMSMDVRPLILRNGLSLNAIRSRAVTQVVLDSLVDPNVLQRVHREFAWTYAALGSCGISTSLSDHPTIGLTADFEVVHPREIMPWPTLGMDLGKQRGIMRCRTVPLDFLKQVYGKKVTANLGQMEFYETECGNTGLSPIGPASDQPYPMAGAWSVTGGGGIGGGGTGTPGGGSTTLETTKIVTIRELWQWGPRGTVDRYVVASGDYVIDDQDLTGMGVYCPLNHVRFMETGSFYGAGMFDLLYPIAREHERLISSLFNNIRDSDRYGVIVMPTGQWNLRSQLQDVGRGLRVLPWEPDPIAEGFKPFPIQPWNSGDAPGRVSAMAKDLMESIDPVRDLLKEKGRVDSETGLQFLDEQINKALTHPTDGVVQVWSNTYRVAGQQAAKALTLSRRALPVNSLTVDLAGAVINMETGEVSFSQNPIPDISRLLFTVRNINPKSELARKQEGLLMLKTKMELGRPDWDAFVLFALKEGLDYAMWLDEERSAYDSVVRDILGLFNDGEQPGEITISPHTSRPELQLRVLTAFMADPIMRLASVDVQDAFAMYRESLLEFMGMVLPGAVPNPEDAAMLNQAAPMPMLPPGGQGPNVQQPPPQEGASRKPAMQGQPA